MTGSRQNQEAVWQIKNNNLLLGLAGARDAINETAERLLRIREQMTPDEPGRIRTLRAVKFVIY